MKLNSDTCNSGQWHKVGMPFVLIALTIILLSGCYYIPYNTKLFLDDYNKRHPPGESPETLDESLEDLKTYEAQSMPFVEWRNSAHYQDIKASGGDRWKNVQFIMENMPADGVLVDSCCSA